MSVQSTDFSRRTALVTGASSGIGFAISQTLAELGHDLTLVGRDPARLSYAADALVRGPSVHRVVADVADTGQINRAVHEHREQFGRLDVLVNCAGIGIGSKLEEIDSSVMDQQLNVDFRSVVTLTRAALPMLRAAGGEHGTALVINVASIFGKRGGAWISVYSAAKAGVIAFTESMNRELAPAGIRATALCPALVDTPMTRGVQVPQPLMGPTDIAEGVRFLLRLSPTCAVPEIQFLSPGDAAWPAPVTAPPAMFPHRKTRPPNATR